MYYYMSRLGDEIIAAMQIMEFEFLVISSLLGFILPFGGRSCFRRWWESFLGDTK